MLPVSRHLPQFAVEDVGRDDLLKAPLVVLAADEGDKSVVDVGPARQEEAAAGAELMEEEQLLILWGGRGEGKGEGEREDTKREG